MLLIDSAGKVQHSRVKLAIAPNLEKGPLPHINGIIVHQTDGASAESAFDSYKKTSPNGTHFLIDKDGTVYQTASLHKKTTHIGKLKARCLLQKTCTPAEATAYRKFNPTGMHRREMTKKAPDRFPSNEDSIGIELVGQALPRGNSVPEDKKVFESVTTAQNASLAWLVSELAITLGVPLTEVFRHPDVSWKNKTEASTAKW